MENIQKAKDTLITIMGNPIYKSVRVYYTENMVEGFLHKVSYVPFEMWINLHRVPKGANSHHYIDFEKAEKIEITFNDDSIQIFE